MSAFSYGNFAHPPERLIPNPKLKFLDQCREVMAFKRFSRRTVEAYLHWIKRFILWSGKRHPRELGGAELTSFLAHLAVREQVAASTQNQALNAIVFMYGQVLGRDLGDLGRFERARRPRRVPIVLSREEARHSGGVAIAKWALINFERSCEPRGRNSLRPRRARSPNQLHGDMQDACPAEYGVNAGLWGNCRSSYCHSKPATI